MFFFFSYGVTPVVCILVEMTVKLFFAWGKGKTITEAGHAEKPVNSQ